MGTKENIDFIKQELSNEEKLLESVIRLEKWYKKYSKIIVSAVVLLLVAGVGYSVYEWKKQSDLEESNIAYLKLLKNPKDATSLQILQDRNPKLYMLYLYQIGVKHKNAKNLETVKKGGDTVLSDLATYHLAVINKDQKALQVYANKETILKEFAILDRGYALLARNSIKEAHKVLDSIGQNSQGYLYAKILKHYGVKENR
ncbi:MULTISPECIES: tetratricopeptide repeat protein [unclassified Nitratiruptor]|uniref:tetratricopeptide repeat protein n=1 Tax=unclassified Nitratiruptor TaxID=2624044 RepID=UPI0019166AC5|nr:MULTISPECIES: tetratricopeptide repeat protein [unclassified Nitratiruptor]BCD60105.1 hypothetical protein NitYY0810_C0870 [Nitratiruptor sp. YY08-10]BCD64406.1 hypothetical protein NitYY0814_C1251 [Nitratiruptor sp. YY08-14]